MFSILFCSRHLLVKMKRISLIQYVVTKCTILNGFLRMLYLVWFRYAVLLYLCVNCFLNCCTLKYRKIQKSWLVQERMREKLWSNILLHILQIMACIFSQLGTQVFKVLYDLFYHGDLFREQVENRVLHWWNNLHGIFSVVGTKFEWSPWLQRWQ